MLDNNPVFRSLEFIESQILEKLSVENIANGIYFSKYHYSRMFREIIGDSVMDYVTKRKLTLAGKTLLESDKSITDIAFDYGYDSREGFTRSFKAYMGVSPTEYRKYGLSAISQKIIKEKYIMTYQKNTDEMIRELNDLIAKAKETAAQARKCDFVNYVPFWNGIADKTDDFTNNIQGAIERIAIIAEQPDEITNRFTIIKIIDDIAFWSNIIAFNTGLTISRAQPDDCKAMWPLCEKYLELARSSVLKAEKIVPILHNLASLIIDDMRENAEKKIQLVIKTGKDAADMIVGYSYIRDEIRHMVEKISTMQYDDVTVSSLEECLFQLDIISFSADIDVFREPQDKVLFAGLTDFREKINEALDFFQVLIKQEKTTFEGRTIKKRFIDIAYQGNIMLFVVRGEIEKLGKLLNIEQKEVFNKICGEIDDFILYTHNATEDTSLKGIADMLYTINSRLVNEAEELKEYGGAIKFLANEFKAFADNLMKSVN